MAVSVVASRLFSTCGKRQYFAIVLDRHGFVKSTGYNGVPSGATHCVDGGCPRLALNSPSGSVYDDCFSIHAEHNATIRAAPEDMRGGTIIVNGPPCFTCAKGIVNCQFARVAYIRDDSYQQFDIQIEPFLLENGIELVPISYDDLNLALTSTAKACKELVSARHGI